MKSLLILACTLIPFQAISQAVHPPLIPFQPETYVAYKIDQPLVIDGDLSKPEWQQAPWTQSFEDIQGDILPSPRYQTNVKMLWDDAYFYFAAWLEEPHIWATLTERDAVIFWDNDFEIFIDPNGSTHHYYEFEVNAKGTFWDLMLTKPYRNGGKPIDAWDIKGIQIGIGLQGTLNNTADTDSSWTVEVAIPWDVLEEATDGGRPDDGDQWRVNFSRVQWQTEIIDGNYVKVTDPQTGQPLPEDNWTWSPQGVINMHFPEMWGFVQFSEQLASDGTVDFVWNRTEDYKWLLRKLYYRQIDFRNSHGHYTDQKEVLGYEELFNNLFGRDTPKPELTIRVLDDNYLMRLTGGDMQKNIYIRQDSKVWTD